jgi:hypothetical protein
MVAARQGFWIVVLACAFASCEENRIVAIGRNAETGGGAGSAHDAGAGQDGGGAAGAAGKAGIDGGEAEAGSDAADGQGKGGEAGAGGTGGSADADAAASSEDCAQECAGNYCLGQSASNGCSECLFLTVCVQAEARAASAPGLSEYESCTAGCATPACLDACCTQQAQACWATRLEHECACGYPVYNCSTACADACSGTMSPGCETCMRDTPCGGNVYDYETTSDVQGRACLDGCGGDATCVFLCCPLYPVACAPYQLAVTCICGG